MIVIRFEPYCQNCTELQPTADIATADYADGERIVSTCVYCEHEERCKVIKKHLKEVGNEKDTV